MSQSYTYYYKEATELEKATLMVKPEPWTDETEYVTVKFKDVQPSLRIDWLSDGTMIVNEKEMKHHD